MSKQTLLKNIMNGMDRLYYTEQVMEVLTAIVGLSFEQACAWRKDYAKYKVEAIQQHKEHILQVLGETFGTTVHEMLLHDVILAKSKLHEDIIKDIQEQKIVATIDSILKPTRNRLKYTFQLHMIFQYALGMNADVVMAHFERDFKSALENYKPSFRAYAPNPKVYAMIESLVCDFPTLQSINSGLLAFGTNLPEEEEVVVDPKNTTTIAALEAEFHDQMVSHLDMTKNPHIIPVTAILSLDDESRISGMRIPSFDGLYGNRLIVEDEPSDEDSISLEGIQRKLHEQITSRTGGMKNPQLISIPLVISVNDNGLIDGTRIPGFDNIYGKIVKPVI